jgi:hypothetical protein
MSFSNTITFGIFGTALCSAVVGFAKGPNYDTARLEPVKQCITHQFTAAHLEVSGAQVLPFRGYVAGREADGTRIGISFTDGGTIEVVLDRHAFTIDGTDDNGLTAASDLSDKVRANCRSKLPTLALR